MLNMTQHSAEQTHFSKKSGGNRNGHHKDTASKPKPKSVKINNDTYTKYFSEGAKAKEITETIEKALAFYFANISEDE